MSHPASVPALATIGYESVSVGAFLETLRAAQITLLVDVRAVASSRRPGFAKSRLAANLATVEIGYEHLRALGTPSDGRAAARSGQHEVMREIFLEHLATPDAQAGLDHLESLVRSPHRVAILCFERDPAHCHRSLVAAALAERLPLDVVHLRPELDD